jgi:hypothetical protein
MSKQRPWISFTNKHFAAENVSKSILYSILQRFESEVMWIEKKELIVRRQNHQAVSLESQCV